MRVNEVPQSSQPPARGDACAVIAANPDHPQLRRSMESLGEHTPAETPLVCTPPTAAGVNLFFEYMDSAVTRAVVNTVGFNAAPELTTFTVPVEWEPPPNVRIIAEPVISADVCVP